jgi:hypothetical protein
LKLQFLREDTVTIRQLFFVFVALAAMMCGSAANSQTSTSLVESNPEAAYQAAKQAMQRLYDRYEKKSRFSNSICTYAGDHLGEQAFDKHDDQLIVVADLAYRVVYLSNDLRRLGYPSAVWQGILSAYEQEALNHLSSQPNLREATGRLYAFSGKLGNSLRDYRLSHPGLGDEYLGGECGDAEIEAKIVTQPQASQVLFTPSFYYELCVAQKIDPEDTKRCNRWREAVDGKVEYVSGDYHYIARWSDGTTRRGTFRFGVNDDGKLITLRKP